MTVHTTITIPARQRHRSLAVWVIALAGLTIATVVAVFLVTGGHRGTGSIGAASSSAQPAQGQVNSAAMASIMALTPARFAAGALGAGYALPSRQSGPTVASVLASMSPQTRRYTEAVMSLTFAQLAAGAAGSP